MRTFKIVFLFIAFALSSHAFAQKNQFEKGLYVGFGGGALTSSVDFVPSILQKTNLGIHGGLSAKYISEKHLGVILELNYAQRGWSEDYEENPEYIYNRTLNYLEIPFMTHIYFGRKVRFVFNAGPQIGFLLGHSSQMSDELKSYVNQTQEQVDFNFGAQYDNDLKKFDYGIIGGAGVEIKSGVGSFQLEGRYYFGLGDVFESRKSKDNFFFHRSAHRIIEGKLSYYFKLK